MIGETTRDSFIGEITCLKGDPATAMLRKLCQRNPALQTGLEQCFAPETSRKFVAANYKQVEMVTAEG